MVGHTGKQAHSAVKWSGIDVLLRQGVGFTITIVLARLLTPEDFGVIALLVFFIALGNIFSNAGFSFALIQKRDITHVDESTVFWFNVIAAISVALIMIVLASWIAYFFGINELNLLVYVMAFVVVINSLGSIHSTLLTKALNFKIQAVIGMLSMLISGAVAVYMAYHDFGVWALASQTAISASITTLFLWVMHSWRPMFVFSIGSLKRMFEFGGYMFAASLLQVLCDKGYSLLLGKLFDISQLGLFDRADKTQRLVSETMTGIVGKVAFPLYSKFSDDKKKLRRVVRISVRSLLLVMAPLMLSFMVFSSAIILGVFGERWLPAVPIFQVLCLVGLFYPLQSVNVTALQAQGYANLNFKLTVIKRGVGIALLVIGSFWGAIGVAWAMVAQSFISLFINAHYSRKLLGYGIMAQLKDCMSSVLVSLVVLSCVLLFNHLYGMSGYLMLFCDVIFGVLIYIGINVSLKLGALSEAVEFTRTGRL